MGSWKGKKRAVTKPSKQTSKAEQALHPEAVRALKIIRSHAAVVGRVKEPVPLADGGFVIKFQMGVPLPSRKRREGITETGVRAQESVVLSFPSAYPFRAPLVSLRPNFNRGLAHINPLFGVNKEEGYVTPCVYDGSLDELMHQEADGLSDILNFISEWLGKAAINDLIDYRQGWEPIRRDGTIGWIVYDLSGFRGLVQDGGDALAFQCRFVEDPARRGDSCFVWGIDHEQPKGISPWLMDTSYLTHKTSHGTVNGSLVLFIWPDRFVGDQAQVADQYLPETINTLSQLRDRAKEYGCLRLLDNALGSFCWAYDRSALKQSSLPLFVVFCVRRPCNIIGDSSSLELIPYMIDCCLEWKPSPLGEGTPQIADESPVFPTGHRHAISGELFRRMSGAKEVSVPSTIVHLGCGSVGSKIAMHLARAGHGPFLLVDKSAFSPHNAARHALMVLAEIPGQPKASLLTQEIRALGQQAKAENVDIIDMCKSSKKDFFPSDTHLIVDTTGSAAVREMLISLPPDTVPGRVFHAALYERGQIGIVAIEGRSRNPNVNDLVTLFWNERVSDEKLNSVFSSDKDALGRQEVGLGCGSHTMVMPDSRVSLFAAGMAERARGILENASPENGELWIGYLDERGMGVTWKSLTLQKITTFTLRANNTWEIRILPGAAEQMEKDAKAWSNIETGGVLIGRLSLARRCVTVSMVLEAPPDSKRAQASFILGTEGLTRAVQRIRKRSGGLLSYIGTWHSHPQGGGASPTDKNGLDRLKRRRFGAPCVALIWTPSGYSAIMDEGKLE